MTAIVALCFFDGVLTALWLVARAQRRRSIGNHHTEIDDGTDPEGDIQANAW